MQNTLLMGRIPLNMNLISFEWDTEKKGGGGRELKPAAEKINIRFNYLSFFKRLL